MRFVLIDCNNLAHRMKHVVKYYESFDECVGLILQKIFYSMRRSFDRFGAEHVVACFDSHSWRLEHFPEYKADRKSEYAHLTPSQIEEEEIIREVLNELRIFLQESTNVTVLSAPRIEADDFIARWIDLHSDPVFSHIIISADGDFKQLVNDRVHLFDPMFHRLFVPEGVFIQDGKPFRKDDEVIEMYGEKWKVKYNKETAQKELVEPEWALFLQCIRGGKNNLRSAYPRVYTTKLRKAFENKGGVEWNNVLNHIWGPDNARQSVRQRYDFNRFMLDLRRQPEDIKVLMDQIILDAIEKQPARMIGAYFAQFVSRYDLRKLMNYPDPYVRILSTPYDT